MTSQAKRLQQGFTLVELLIVVIILAILAAIVVPQFASSTDDAKLSSLDTTLSNVRGAIDLYYQHHGEYPGFNTAVPAAGCATGTKGLGTGGAGAQGVTAFNEQLSMYTDNDGAACSIKDTTFKYGPYLKKAALPANPINDDATLVVVDAGDLAMTGDAGAKGWKFDIKTGKFIADDSTNDPSGNPYHNR
jgi:prepilin-type N-terminal cleavage/methylation domain-containing protein